MTLPTLLIAAIVALQAPPPRPLVLTGGTLVDPSPRANDVRDAVIVMNGGEIVAAGARKDITIPDGANVVPIDGAFVVPGLHDVFAGLNSQSQANAYLYMGVTSIVGLDEPGGRRGALLMTARPSPRIRRLGVVDGLPDSGSVPVDADPVLAQIDTLASRGARVLLLHYPLGAEQTRNAVRRARELGLATIGELGHTTYTQGIEVSVDAFVHASRYALELAPPSMREEVAGDPFGPPRTAFYQFLAGLAPDTRDVTRWAARLAESQVALIPTLSLYYLGLPQHGNPWKEPIAAILSPKDVHLPADRVTGIAPAAPGIPAGLSANLLRIEERNRRAGARYLAGSGTSAFGTLPGISLHNELRMLTGLGLTPRQALAAATVNVSEVFRWPKTGRLEPGCDADLVVVDADPTLDVRNLKRIRMVVLDGKVVHRAALLKRPVRR